MKSHVFLRAALSTLCVSSLLADNSTGCGNPGTTPDSGCGPCDDKCDKVPDSNSSYDASSGNEKRTSLDLDVAGATGGLGLKFQRHFYSRVGETPLNEWSTSVFGNLGRWKHNFQWRLEISPVNYYNMRWADIYAPDGSVYKFTVATAASGMNDWGRQATTAGRFWNNSQRNIFTFQLPDGRKVIFVKHVDTTGTYYLAETIVDTKNLAYTLEYNDKRNLVKVTEPAGRWLAYQYEDRSIPNGSGVTATVRVLSQVSASDGRSVQMLYGTRPNRNTSDPSQYANLVLTGVDYGDGSKANYVWAEPYGRFSMPIELYEPKKVGSIPWVKLSYQYEWNGYGMVRQMQNGKTGSAIVTRDMPSGQNIFANGAKKHFEFTVAHNFSYSRDSFGNTINFTYDPNGFAATKTDRTNATTSYVRDNQGRVISQTDALGNTRLTTYDAQGNVLTETDVDGAVTTYERDTNGNLVKISYPDGSHEQFTYNTFGQILTHTDKNGGIEQNTYDARGLKTSSTDALGKTTTYTYDAQDRLASLTDPLNHTTSYEYDWNGWLTKTTYADGKFVTKTYDAFGNVLTETDELGHTTTKEYDEFKRLVKSTDPLGGVTTYNYDFFVGTASACCGSNNTAGKPTLITSPGGRKTFFQYDVEWRLLEKHEGYQTPEVAITKYSYDAEGRVISQTDPLGNVTHTEYDALGRVKSRTDALNQKTQFAYDDLNRSEKITRPDNSELTTEKDVLNRTVKITDSLAREIHFTYNLAGDRIESKDSLNRSTQQAFDLLHRPTVTTFPDTSTRSTTYNDDGTVKETRDELGNLTRFAYDARHRQISVTDATNRTFTTTYDAKGQTIAQTSPSGKTTHTSYDALGRPTAQTLAPGTALASTTSTAYDADSLVTSQTDALGKTTTFTYDARRNRLTVKDPLNRVTTFQPDLRGQITQTTAPDGVKTSASYDPLGRKLSETDGRNATTIFTYRYDGKLLSYTDPNGATYSFAYDTEGQRTSRTFPDSTQEKYTYFADGTLEKLTKPDATEISHAYDARGRLTQQSNSATSEIVSFSYDAKGQLLSATNAGTQLARSYDPAGRLLSETTTVPALLGNNQGDAKTVTYSHDADGNLAQIIRPNGATDSLSYDARNQLASVANSLIPNGNAISYTRNARGQILSTTNGNGISNVRNYDDAGQLLQSDYQDDQNLVSRAQYEYSLAGQRTKLTRENAQSEQFSYDASRQLTAITRGVSASQNDAYSYDLNGNRLNAKDQNIASPHSYAVNNLNQYTQISGKNLAYDANGNQTSSPQDAGALFQYDWNDRLVKVNATSDTKPQTATSGLQWDEIQYIYDALGRRLGKIVMNGGSLARNTRFIYDGWNVVEERRVRNGAAGVVVRNFVWGEDLSGSLQGAGGVGGLIASLEKTTTGAWTPFYYHYDGNGNVTNVTNSTKSSVAKFTYDGFGRTVTQTGSKSGIDINALNYRFSTKPMELELATSNTTLVPPPVSSGLYYYGYRFYSPNLGRWISRDPIREKGGRNLYNFVGNDGVDKWDKLGLEEACCNGKKYNPEKECCEDGYIVDKKGGPVQTCCPEEYKKQAKDRARDIEFYDRANPNSSMYSEGRKDYIRTLDIKYPCTAWGNFDSGKMDLVEKASKKVIWGTLGAASPFPKVTETIITIIDNAKDFFE